MFYVLDNSLTMNRIKYIFAFSILVHLIGVSWISESLITYGSINYVISYTITFLLINFEFEFVKCRLQTQLINVKSKVIVLVNVIFL